MEFQIVKITKNTRALSFLIKALIEAELRRAQKQEIISKLEKGQVLEGTVKNITPYGVFIDLGGVDGLIHHRPFLGRVSDLHEIVQLDQKLNVVFYPRTSMKRRSALPSV